MKSSTLLNLFVSLALSAGSAGVLARPRADPAAPHYTLHLAMPADMSREASGIFRQRLQAGLAKAGLLGTGASAHQLDVVVTHYQMRPGAARAWVGVMAGTDRLESTVSLKDPRGRTPARRFSVSSKNVTAWGSSRGLIQKHADQIVLRVKQGG